MRWLGTVLLAFAAPGCSWFLSDGDNSDNDGGADGSATLDSLEVSRGEIEPPFDPAVTEYSLILPLRAADLAVTPTAASGIAIEVDGIEVASGAASPLKALGLGDNLVEIVVTAPGDSTRRYTIDVARGPGILEDAYAKASNTGRNDVFGSSVAIDGDTLVVGAPGEGSDTNMIDGDQSSDVAPSSGAVYVFVRADGDWVQQAYIKASNSDAGDRFGQSVALDGDRLAVGAPGEQSVSGLKFDNDANGVGAVYVYTRTGGIWGAERYVKASNRQANDDFGRAVAIDGDILAVGAPLEDSDGTDPEDDSSAESGAVYVYRFTDPNWSLEVLVKPTSVNANARFGSSLSLDGETLAAGAPLDANGGAAYVFVANPNGDVWGQEALLQAPEPDAGDSFGSSISLDGDTVVVGAPAESGSATGINGVVDNNLLAAGAAYVYTRASGEWSLEAYVKASNTGQQADFGRSVSLDDDVLAIGAPGEASDATGVHGDQDDTSADNAGAIYVYARSGAAWSQLAYIKASNTDPGDELGRVVATDGASVVGGAPSEDSDATGVDNGGGNNLAVAQSSGAVYLFQ